MSGTDDPTLDTLAELDDPGKYAVKRGVPIFVPHERIDVGPDGKRRVIKVTAADLAKYADRINELERERGVIGRITDRHLVRPTKDDPLPPQPKLLGYYRGATVGTFGPKNTPAVLTDLYYRRECLGIVRDRPYRSPEVYPERYEIRGLALLLADPWLDMGTVTYDRSRDHDRPVCYGSEHMPGTPGPTNAAPAAPAAPAATNPAEKPEYSPEEEAQYQRCAKYFRTKYGLGEHWPGEKPKEDYQVGDGTSKNQDGQRRAMNAKDPDDHLTSTDLSRAGGGGGVPVEYAREIGQLRAQLAGLTLEREHERCNALLYSLEAEGYQFSAEDRAEELKTLVSKSDADRQKHVARVRRLYEQNKVPGGRLLMYGGPVEPGTAPDPNDPFGEPPGHRAAVEYMMAHPGTTYAAALEHAARGGK